MSYYQENRPTMGGLADALAMQGRRGDSTLVHMNPMEVRMLETMSPDGRLSINPETGLPEAFKLKDLAAIALPIAAGAFLGPAAAGLLGTSALTGTAVATGLGGVGAGLLQGKGVGDSLIQGGLSGLMSYGHGSAMGAFAPSGGVTASPVDPATASLGYEVSGVVPTSAEISSAVTPAATEPTGFFGGLGETLRQTPFTDVPSVGSPTYGSMLGSGASGLLSSSLLAPEEMPYDIAGMDDMDAYYGSVPDLEAGRRRGRARARALNMPPAFSSPAELRRTAETSGFGTFLAADGGQVPNPYGDPYGDPYGPGDAYGGVADASNTSGTPGSESTPGSTSTSGLGSFGNSIDMGLGVANPSPMSIAASLAGLALGIPGLGPAVAIGRGLANAISSFDVQTSPTGQTQVSGVGNETMDMFGNVVGTPEHTANLLGYSPTDPMNSKLNFNYATVSDVSPDEVAAQQAIADFAEAHAGEVGPGGGGSPGEEGAAASAGMGMMAQGGVVDFYAQGGGISSLAYGGEAAPVGFANKAFEGMVPGDGTGMSDDVPFSIEGNQPALLSRDEYVLPADIVSQLGDGSSGAGADMLDNFISQVRQTKYGNTQQPAPVGPQLMTGLMRQGGVV